MKIALLKNLFFSRGTKGSSNDDDGESADDMLNLVINICCSPLVEHVKNTNVNRGQDPK